MRLLCKTRTTTHSVVQRNGSPAGALFFSASGGVYPHVRTVGLEVAPGVAQLRKPLRSFPVSGTTDAGSA